MNQSQRKGVQAPLDTICKTIHQYSKGPVPEEDMEKLSAIANDCRTVKNYVYTRYGGKGSLAKLYPGYTVQNEMTRSGLREQLGLPSVYFYLAMFDALADIKSQWTRTKAKVLELAGKNESLTEEEKHYLRFLLKVSNAFEAVVNEMPIHLQKELQTKYECLAGNVDVERLHRYLCRQVRKYHQKLHTDRTDGFSVSAKAYRYEDHGIYLATKEKRKRVFISLTDKNQYESQIYIKLFPEEKRLEIRVPVNVAIRSHADYTRQVGVSPGLLTMFTTDEGHKYGELLGKYQLEYADWIREQIRIYNENRQNNPGRKKYQARKNRYEEQLHSYINQELNRFLQTEKPRIIWIPKLPKPQAGGASGRLNHMAALWQRGYIRKRLIQKCQEQSVEVVDVFGKDISRECSRCGAIGNKKKGEFVCASCGYLEDDKTNAARNAKNRGIRAMNQEDHKSRFLAEFR